MKKPVFAIVFTLVCVANLAMLAWLPINASKASTSKAFGYVQIKVLDAHSLKPIPNATVCIIENGAYTTTNKNGDTEKLQVPVNRNTSFDNILLRDWGDFTLLIYKAGYATHISFYNEVYAGVTRVGLVYYLTASTENYSITTNANAPNSAYLETLVMHYKK